MKRSTSLLLLVMALGHGAESFAFLNQAAAAGTPRNGLGAHPAYENRAAAQINAIKAKSHGDEKKLPRAGPIDEVEAKRLKLIFLLMMSLGQYRSAVH